MLLFLRPPLSAVLPRPALEIFIPLVLAKIHLRYWDVGGTFTLSLHFCAFNVTQEACN